MTSSISHSPPPWNDRGLAERVEQRLVFDALGITRNSPGEPPHDDVVDDVGVVGVEQVRVLRAPGPMRSRSLVNAHCNVANAPAPCTRTEPRCDTSKTTACSRHARCSSSTPVYWMGISHPPNGTMRAQRAVLGVERAVAQRPRTQCVGHADSAARPGRGFGKRPRAVIPAGDGSPGCTPASASCDGGSSPYFTRSCR